MYGNGGDPLHKPRNPKTSHNIAGTACNGCAMCEVITKKMRFRTEERYYCNKVGRFMAPMESCQAVKK